MSTESTLTQSVEAIGRSIEATRDARRLSVTAPFNEPPSPFEQIQPREFEVTDEQLEARAQWWRQSYEFWQTEYARVGDAHAMTMYRVSNEAWHRTRCLQEWRRRQRR
jgi:hypothetical protein